MPPLHSMVQQIKFLNLRTMGSLGQSKETYLEGGKEHLKFLNLMKTGCTLGA